MIVHANAAYSILARRGLVKPCNIGGCFATSAPHDAENSNEYVLRMAREHCGSLKIEDDRNSQASSSQPRTFVGSHTIRILTVMSGNQTFSRSSRRHRKRQLQLKEMPCPCDQTIENFALVSKGGAIKLSQDLVSPVTAPNIGTQYISHYLLQIESSLNQP